MLNASTRIKQVTEMSQGKTYDYKELIRAYLEQQRWKSADKQLQDYSDGLFRALSDFFNIGFDNSDIETYKMREKTEWARIYLGSFQSAKENYLKEYGAGAGLLEAPREYFEFFENYARRTYELAEQKKQAHFDFMCAIVEKLYDGLDKTITSSELKKRGFDDANKPDPNDFW